MFCFGGRKLDKGMRLRYSDPFAKWFGEALFQGECDARNQ